MLHANINDNINIIIQTGGCKNWNNTVISNRNIERYTINSQGLLRLDTNIKNASMTEEETIWSYIFPVMRYHSRITKLTSEDFEYVKQYQEYK